tara:strand:- start:12521 stop:13654 length:1134 start_codon:yes stop_codon:yes gene_type:complete
MTDIAERFELSAAAIVKYCKKSNIPRPPRGHWAKNAVGKCTPKAPLPKRGPGMSDEIIIGGGPHAPYRHLSDEVLLAFDQPPPVFEEPIAQIDKEVRAIIKEVPIPPFPSHAHHKIRRLLDADNVRRQKQLATKYTSHWDAPLFDDPIEQRRLEVINAIMTGLERAGMRASIEDQDGRRLYAAINDTNVFYTLDTISQKRDPRRRNALDTRGPSDKLRCAILKTGSGSIAEQTWEDTPHRRLERQLVEIVRSLIVTAEIHHRHFELVRYNHLLERKAYLIERLAAEKAEAERKEKERIAAIDQAKLDRLLADAQSFRQAADIRAFVADVGARHNTGDVPISIEKLMEWKTWALEQANRMDPIRSGRFIESVSVKEDN